MSILLSRWISIVHPRTAKIVMVTWGRASFWGSSTPHPQWRAPVSQNVGTHGTVHMGRGAFSHAPT